MGRIDSVPVPLSVLPTSPSRCFCPVALSLRVTGEEAEMQVGPQLAAAGPDLHG